MSTTVAALAVGGCGGGATSSAVPQAGNPVTALTAAPNPVNSTATVVQSYQDDGSRVAVSGATTLPATLTTQSVVTGSGAFSDTFSDQSTSAWTPINGTWKICTRSDGGYGYCGTSNGDQAISTTGSGTLGNYRIESWVRLGSDDGNASIVSRYVDAGHFYELELRTYNGVKSWFIWKNVNGSWTSVAGGNFSYVAGGYYRLRLDAYGSKLTASVSTDGSAFRTLGSGTDTTYTTGSAGLRTFGDASTTFDNVTLTPFITAPTAAPSAAASGAATPPAGASVNPTPTAAPTASPSPAAGNFTISLGTEQLVPDSVPGSGMDAGTRRNFPDAHFSVVAEPSGGDAMFWGIGNTYRSTGPNQYPQSQSNASIVLATYGDTGPGNPWEDGSQGNWMLSVNRVGVSNTLIGFEHLEESDIPGVYLYNTVQTTSQDDGRTWSVGQRIVVFPSPYPGNTPLPSQYTTTGYGPGNDLVVRDTFKNRWVLIVPQGSNTGFYTSTDPNGAAGTWSQGPDRTTISGTWNPSVVWNTYLGEWLMVWQNGCNLYYSTSLTLDQWTPQQTLLTGGTSHCYSYPTMIGTDDKLAGQSFTLYYADWNGPYLAQSRSFEYQHVTLQRPGLIPGL